MTTSADLWVSFARVNVYNDKELLSWIAAICSHALSTGETIHGGSSTGASLKLRRELKVQPDWNAARMPADKAFATRRQWLLTWFMNALNPKDGQDMAVAYRLCMENAKQLLPMARRCA